jgi:class 3 adenylate cyclase
MATVKSAKDVKILIKKMLVSQTVRDLVAGSGLALEDRGTHALKGVPNEWRLFRAITD